MTRLHAIILAGGRSARMGRDKASLAWRGRPAVQVLADLARRVGARSVTVAGPDYGLPYVTDPILHGGPVGGLLAAARALIDAERLLVLAVDTPTLQAADLEPLLAADLPGASYAGFPLPMVIARSAIPWEAAADSPLRRFVDAAGLAQLGALPGATARLAGANTAEEFDALQDADGQRGAA